MCNNKCWPQIFITFLGIPTGIWLLCRVTPNNTLILLVRYPIGCFCEVIAISTICWSGTDHPIAHALGCLFEVLPIISYEIAERMRQLVEQKKNQRIRQLSKRKSTRKRKESSDFANENTTLDKINIQNVYEYAKAKLQKELERENESNQKTLEKKRGTFVQVTQCPWYSVTAFTIPSRSSTFSRHFIVWRERNASAYSERKGHCHIERAFWDSKPRENVCPERYNRGLLFLTRAHF